MESENSKSYVTAIFCTYNMVELIPFLTFYLLDRPHDCFECLGKDPDRIYSSLQLTKLER